MQRAVFYAILGISIVITAISLGYSTSRYVSARSYVPPAPHGNAAPPASPGNKAALPAERWTNLFAPSAGMEIPSRLPGGGVGAAVAASDTAYVLLGTIFSDSPASRRAILWAEGMTNPLLAREHEEVEPGVRVASVGREHVVLRRGTRQERIELLPVGSRTRTPARGAAVAPPAAARPREARAAPAAGVAVNVNRIGENAYALDEATIGQLTDNINQFMTQVRIIPYFEGNKSAGYRLAAMRPGSAFEKLGFRGGDVIQRVNDVELTSPEKMYTIFQNLKDEKRVAVDVLRQGQKTTLRYEIR